MTRKESSSKPVVNCDARSETAQKLLAEGGVIGVQVLNEFATVVRRKLGMRWAEVLEALAAIRVLCPLAEPLTIETHEAARRIAEQHGYGLFDGLVIGAALEAACRTLYSEDVQHGQVIEGLVIRNPFLNVDA